MYFLKSLIGSLAKLFYFLLDYLVIRFTSPKAEYNEEIKVIHRKNLQQV